MSYKYRHPKGDLGCWRVMYAIWGLRRGDGLAMTVRIEAAFSEDIVASVNGF